MSKYVEYDPEAVCDICGKKGAFDFYSDIYCQECLNGRIESMNTDVEEHSLFDFEFDEEFDDVFDQISDDIDENDIEPDDVLEIWNKGLTWWKDN